MSARILSLMLLLFCGTAEALEKAPKSEAPRLLSEGLGDTAVGLLIVLALIAALAWGLRRFGRLPMGGRGAVQVLGGVSLGNRERAVLLSVQGTRLLVGVAPGQVRTLHVLENEETTQDRTVPTSDEGFAHQLQKAGKEHKA